MSDNEGFQSFLAFFSQRQSTFPRIWELATLRIQAARTKQGPMITMVSKLSRLSESWHGEVNYSGKVLFRAHLTNTNLLWILTEYERLQGEGIEEGKLLGTLLDIIVSTPTNGNTIEHVLPEGPYGSVKVSFGDESETSKFLNIIMSTSNGEPWEDPIKRVFSYTIRFKGSGEVEEVINTSTDNDSSFPTLLEQLEIIVSLLH